MQIIPSVDIYRGEVVRLVKGEPSTSKTYLKDPLEAAGRWSREGADAIHIVDIDSALGTGFDNHPHILRIVRGVDLPVQVGGGVRSFEYASSLLQEGVSKIVVGTSAFRDRATFERMLKAFGSERVVVALDYVGDEVVVKGWTSHTGVKLQDALAEFQRQGADRFLLTSVERDGTLTGPDYKTLAEASVRPGMKIIASGGISSVDDIIRLREVGVYGAVIGKALYEGRFELKEAVSAAKRR